MTESEREPQPASDPGSDEEKEQIPYEGHATAPFGAEQDQPGAGGKLHSELGVGGYEGRDPKTDMPRIPSVPETQEDPRSHDAAPDPDEEPPAS